MPVPGYGVLIGRASDRRLATPKKNHYEIRIEAAGASYRVAVNVQSVDGSEVLYHMDEALMKPELTGALPPNDGHFDLAAQAGGAALDFVRNLGLHKSDFVPLPLAEAGDDNDLNDKLDHYVQRTMSDKAARVFAFGSFFKNPGKKDEYFGFKPAQGIHDVHFNQGNSGDFEKDNGEFQDGALLFHFPSEDRWVGIFLAFQTQAWPGDDVVVVTPPPPQPQPVAGPERIRIVAAVANSIGSPDVETVTIVNASPDDVDLTGWALADRNRNRFTLGGKLASGDARRVTIAPPMQLSNNGGKITLLDSAGKVVDGVSYTKEQASKPGWSIVF
jgi:uncharacterized protein YukJ